MTTAAQREILDKLIALRPAFPRAGEDIDAVIARAQGGDYKGVLQACRLVLEVVLRDLIGRVLKESPGKRTVDQLVQRISKQQGEPELMPMRVLAHVRTLQAWGNVGAHDHGGSLFEEPSSVGVEDAANSLNSLVAVLSWYREKHLPDAPGAAPVEGPAPTPTSGEPAPRSRGVKVTVTAILIAFGAAALAVAVVLGRGPSGRAQALRQQLDATTRAAQEPLPPADCRAEDESLLELLAPAAASLEGGSPGSDRTQDRATLKRLTAAEGEASMAGEYWLLLAKARLFTGADNVEVRRAAENALARCDGLAAAKNILGTTYLKEGETAAARAAYEGATTLAPDYSAPRFNLALLDLQSGRVDQALETFDAFLTVQPDNVGARSARARARLSKGDAAGAREDLEVVLRANPEDAEAHLLHGLAASKLGDDDAAQTAYCRAKALGHPKAAGLCAE